MTYPSKYELDFLAETRASASRFGFYPRGTVRCTGIPVFRSQATRDLGCLLDLDVSVDAWSCLPLTLSDGCDIHVPDFIAYRGGNVVLLDVLTSDRAEVAAWVGPIAASLGYAHQSVEASVLAQGHRVLNARDVLRYAKAQCALGDRVRIVAALEENGEMPLIEALGAFQESRPIAALCSLVLHRFLSIELDEERIGPSTPVRRAPR